MRYMDPESNKSRRMPTNFDSRQPYTRPNGNGGYQNRQRPPPNNATGAGDGKWQRGHEARPDFQKQRQNLDDELDNYGTKAQKAGTNGNGGGFDDWRKGRGDDAGGSGRVDEGRSLGDRIGGRKERSASPRRRSMSPRRDEPDMRPSPHRGGDRRSEESDMVLDDD